VRCGIRQRKRQRAPVLSVWRGGKPRQGPSPPEPTRRPAWQNPSGGPHKCHCGPRKWKGHDWQWPSHSRGRRKAAIRLQSCTYWGSSATIPGKQYKWSSTLPTARLREPLRQLRPHSAFRPGGPAFQTYSFCHWPSIRPHIPPWSTTE